MKYQYEVIKPHGFRFRIEDCISGKISHLDFNLKKGRDVDVEFACDGFSFNFPLKKNVGSMVFNLNDFSLLLEYGIKIDENSSNRGLDLDVEF
ncbi:hypothetical protein MuYL_0513 [Mucilaginibacter xinganensis]|uniref:Uncharacterized protein n=2 Tax=Mucilaginibacter xinganensis TaxID=1234841 RepID=A0A223NRI7_9SPHI|nr:hypothetical protein MuYL_0513 [Mucilaginibacter xinganensis]